MRLGRPIPVLPTVAAGAMALLAAALLPLFPAYAQSGAGSCANGIAVPDWANNPGLVSDCETLLSARDALAGTGSLNWSSTTAIDQWDGVIVSGAPRRVTEVVLREKQLDGKIPAELGRLSNLQYLRLYGNQLSGEIPAELGSLSNLMALDLSTNRLSGHIPTELANLSKLTLIELYYNQLEGQIPPELGSLSNLMDLSLSQNRFSGPIPLELTTLSNLARLSLNNNRLNGNIPPELGSLRNLIDLGLAGNDLIGHIPVELTTLTNLRFLSLDSNRLVGRIPPELGNLSNMEDLRLSDNQLTGDIPVELASLAKLRWLVLGNNRLTGEIPAELLMLSSLERLTLGSNQLTGEIPSELDARADLRVLGLDDNKLTGEIPRALGSLASLTGLHLAGNQLTGEIPSELGRLANLRNLTLGRNGLTGEIPAALGGLGNLRNLSLGRNGLTGQIPAELGNLSNLGVLVLHHNELTGQIPAELGRLPELWLLVLAENRLSGPIPPQLGNLANLVTMDLRGNELSGEIPGELGGLANLTGLYLANNGLAGCIPGGLQAVQNNDFRDLGLRFCEVKVDDLDGASCADGSAVPDPSNNPGLVSDCEALLSARDTLAGAASLNWSASTPIGWWDGVSLGGTPQRVTELYLHDSGLTGEIPSELSRLSNLLRLNVTNNELTGGIPAELGRLSNLLRLHGTNNRLTGKIPPELGSLLSLESLALAGNQLSGEIPPELSALASLQIMYLAGNRLTGEVPPELGGLANLRSLELGGNGLSGEIPAELHTLSSLEALDLGHNQLTGEIPAELHSLANLRFLNLQANKLTGELPAELGDIASLRSLILDANRLSGRIPSELGRLANLQNLLIDRNQLTGEIPPELGNLTNLLSLDLSGNELSGTIPEELANPPKLEEIRLSSNRLTGCIPERLREVGENDLHSLDLPFCDVLLDNLVVSPGSLAPSFDRYHTDYIAEVTSSIVTILAVSIGNATYQVLEADDREVVDADVTMPGIQIEIGAGTQIDIRVVAADGGATHTYTIGIRRVLGAPTIAAVEAGGGYLAVSWAARDEFAEARTGSYDLRYIPTAADEAVDAHWTVVENVPIYSAGGKLQYTIADLGAGIQYEVQVRAVDRDGEPAAWSASVTETPTTPSVCVTGGAVAVVIDAGIISDCESLLAARDILAGSGRLNWSASTPIKDWDGVTVGGTPARVVGLSVNSRELDGTVPAELGDLTGLRRLHLFENRLSGPIPAELGMLADLQALDLGENRLTGQIPVDLARLSNLQSLDLSDNRLTGQIPSQLGRLAELQDLLLQDNELTGAIPSQLGDLDNLVEVDLSGNNLLGCAPISDGFEHGGPPCFAAEGMAFTVDTSFLLAGDGLRITSVGDAANGVVTLDGTTITYQHDGSETTTGGFTYTFTDGTQTDTALVTIAVNPVNDPPVGVDDALAVQEGDTVSTASQQLLVNDTDPERDGLSITAVGDATNGLVTLDGNTIIYRHDGSETTAGSFAYTVTDGTDTTTALVTIAVSPVNDPPVGVDDALAVQEGDTVSTASQQLLVNDTDPERDGLSITAVGDATNGLVTLDGNTIIYRHDGSETTAGSFAYTVTDGTDSTTALVTIAVNPVNDPPVGVNDALTVREGDTVSVQALELLDNDSDAEGDALSITAVGDATNGLVTLDGNMIVYAHDGSETTAGSFSYTVSDGTDNYTALVTVAVAPVNDPPVGVADALAVQEGDTVSVQAPELLANDSDVERDVLSITAVGDATNGLVTLDGNTISYAHDDSETTAGGFSYTVTDGTDTATALVTITVSPVNDPPVGVNDALAVQEGDTVSIASQQLLANDTDPERDTLSITAVGDAANGLVTLDGNTIVYRHDGSETTTGSYTYTVTDGTDMATVLVTITVAPVTDLPVLLLIAVALGVGLLTLVAVLSMWIRRTKEAG